MEILDEIENQDLVQVMTTHSVPFVSLLNDKVCLGDTPLFG